MTLINFASFSFVLTILYTIVTLLSAFQIFRIVYYRHNPYSYQFGFLLFTLFWSILRAVFWLLIPWPQLQELLLQGTALFIQFATFTFLVLFYAQIVYHAQKIWRVIKIKAIIAFVSVNVLFAIGSALTFGLAHKMDPELDDIQMVHVFFISFMYFILSLFIAGYGWRLLYLVSFDHVKVPFLKSKRQIGVVTIILLLVFTSRSIKDLLSGFSIGEIDISETNMEVSKQVLLFFLMFIWDLVPAFLVIFLFWHIPDSRSIVAYYGPVSQNPQEPTLSAIFTNPQRYDSDEIENEKIAKGSSIIFDNDFPAEDNTPNFVKSPLQGYSTRSNIVKGGPFED